MKKLDNLLVALLVLISASVFYAFCIITITDDLTHKHKLEIQYLIRKKIIRE